MGAVQQRKCEVWLTIERNSKISQKQLFDFTKPLSVVSSNSVSFPSYLHYYQQTKSVTYSLLEDSENQFSTLEYSKDGSKELYFTKNKKNHKEKVWKFLRQGMEAEIEQGDFIKLGRIQLEVKEFRFASNKKSIKNLVMDCDAENKVNLKNSPYLSIYGNNLMRSSQMLNKQPFSRLKDSDINSNSPSERYMKASTLTSKSNNQVGCRFCFDCSSNKTNPLFNVCSCAGSVKMIHFECLKSWIKSKMGKVETSYCIYYHYEPLICELCKHQIKDQIIHQGKKYRLFEAQTIYPPYLRLQHSEDGKIFEILIRLEEGSKIEIGRGSQNELNLDDPSISRSHCSLYYTSHRLFLKGKKSKYGTFVQLSKSIELHENQPIELLIQNNLISIDKRSQQKNFFDQQCCNIQNNYRLIVK